MKKSWNTKYLRKKEMHLNLIKTVIIKMHSKEIKTTEVDFKKVETQNLIKTEKITKMILEKQIRQ